MTTTKKILATTAAIAFAATLSSCEMKKTEEKNPTENSEISNEVENTPSEIINEDINLPETPNQDNPKMKEFEEKQAEMWKLFQDFEANNPEFKALQEEINAIFSTWEQPTEEDMKKVQEIDTKIRALFTPEMKALDEELRNMWNEIFAQPETIEIPAENIETNVPPIENTENTEQPIMELK